MSNLFLFLLLVGLILIARKIAESRVAAALSALAAAMKAAEHDFFGPGNEKATRAFSNAKLLLAQAEQKMQVRDWIGAHEMTKMGRQLLKIAYLKTHC